MIDPNEINILINKDVKLMSDDERLYLIRFVSGINDLDPLTNQEDLIRLMIAIRCGVSHHPNWINAWVGNRAAPSFETSTYVAPNETKHVELFHQTICNLACIMGKQKLIQMGYNRI